MLRLLGVRVNPVVGVLVGVVAIVVGVATDRIGLVVAGAVMLLVAGVGGRQRRAAPDERDRR